MNFRSKYFIVFALALVVSFIIFGNGIKGDFVFDDASIIKNRGDLKDISNFLNLFISPYHQNIPNTGLYRPFTMASYSVNHIFFGGAAASFHVINILIHALNSFLVFWLIDYLFKSKKIAYFTFFLFLTHPLHTEAVTSLVGRAELLAFFWSFITIYFFIKKDKLLSSISFLFALWSKEVALMALPIIFYIDWNHMNKRIFESTKSMLYFSLPIIVYSIFRYLALGKYFYGDVTTTIVENPLKVASFHERIATAFKVLNLYIEKLVWPVDLIADYSYNAIRVVSNIFTSPQAIFGVFILSFFVFLALYSKTRRNILGFGALVFLAPYFMISNLAFPIGTIMGERLMYFPSLGFVLILAYIIKLMVDRLGVYRQLGYSILVIIIIFYGARTIIRNNDWLSSRNLFFTNVELSPNSLITRTALAGVHIRENNWDEAEAQLEVARNIYEDNSHLQNLLGIVADHKGDFELSEQYYLRSLELNPNAINSYINLAELQLKQERYKEAGESLLKVINFYPVPEYVIRYAYVQIALNEPEAALGTIDRYYGQNLNTADLSVVVGTAHFVKESYDQALLYLNNAVSLGNNAPEITEMINISEQKISNF
jgi:protein O-mannosyl-transferase